MSRLLTMSIKMAKRCAARILIFFGLICLLFDWFALGLVLLGIGILNEVARSEMKRQLIPFEARSLVRNVDYLIIGELGKTENLVPDGCSYLQIKLPGCSLEAAYEVLRHSFSILKDNGGVAILAYKYKKLFPYEYSLFDVNFFVPVTIQRLHLKIYKMLSYFPLLFSPVRTLQLLFNIKRRGGISDSPRDDIALFCKERDISLICIRY